MDSLYRINKKLSNEIVDLNNSSRGSSSRKNPFRTFNKYAPQTQTSPTTSGINIEDFELDNFCRDHHANHSKNNCKDFLNLFGIFFSPLA